MHGHANAKHKHKHTSTRSPRLLCSDLSILKEYIQSLGSMDFWRLKRDWSEKFWSVGPKEDWRVLANVSASSSFKADVDHHPSIPSIRPTSPAIAPPAFRAQSPPIWWVFVPEIRIHNHLDLSHFVSLEIRLSYLTHSRRRSRLGRKEFLNNFKPGVWNQNFLDENCLLLNYPKSFGATPASRALLLSKIKKS